VALFGDDPAVSTPDEFFGVIDKFLTALIEAKQENEIARKKREEEEKRRQQEEEVRQSKVYSLFENLTFIR
jgi:hypothetical protein